MSRPVPMPLVLVVDDEAPIRRLCRAMLQRAEYRVAEAGTATEAMALMASEHPDLVLLDLGLPDRDGLELLPLLKKLGTAVVIVSAREATEEKVAALDLGADDYVTKPFDSEELLARVRVALRHRAPGGMASGPVAIGPVTVDLDRHRITRSDRDVHLTRKEFAILALLAATPGRVLTHQHLLKTVWPDAYDPPVEYLRLVVRNLRQKLEDDPAKPTLIINELGVGYRLAG